MVALLLISARLWGNARNAVKGVDYNYDTTTPVVGETLSTNRHIRQYVRLVMRVATKVIDFFRLREAWLSNIFLDRTGKLVRR
jgi:hypothetical protein